MTSTLLLRLSGPMQSWGTRSRFDIRDTGREPSKSGVVGLICAALGRPRSEGVSDLAALKMAVRVDQEGRMERDYHTASSDNFYTVSNKRRSATVVSHRYYLADARFLVGLEGDPGLLSVIHNALRAPHWPLYLGRKAFVPGEPVWMHDSLFEGMDVWQVLSTYPWTSTWAVRDAPDRLRVIYDDPGGSVVRHDHPIHFGDRIFSQRRLSIAYINTPLVAERTE